MHLRVKPLFMNQHLFNRSLFASALVAGALALFSAAGCYKADLKTEPETATKVADATETDSMFYGDGPDAEYKGGVSAWLQFLNTNCKYPEEAVNGEISGTVKVRFVVEKDGSVSNVEALSGPEILRKEAIRVVSASKQWEPSSLNGHKVRSYKIQPIVFRLEQG
jgi:TonB family protein